METPVEKTLLFSFELGNHCVYRSFISTQYLPSSRRASYFSENYDVNLK